MCPLGVGQSQEQELLTSHMESLISWYPPLSSSTPPPPPPPGLEWGSLPSRQLWTTGVASGGPVDTRTGTCEHLCVPLPEGILQYRKLTFSLAWSPFLVLFLSRPEELITSIPHLVFHCVLFFSKKAFQIL